MERFFEIAISEAKKAYKKNEVPVGAVIVKNNKIIAKAHNTRQKKHNVIGHAEIDCILKAEKKLKDWRLDGCTLYVTLEPCDMCKSIILESRISSVYYICSQNKKKNLNTNYVQTNICDKNKQTYISMIDDFFENLRK